MSSQRATLKTESAGVKEEALPREKNINRPEEEEEKGVQNTKPVPKPREANK